MKKLEGRAIEILIENITSYKKGIGVIEMVEKQEKLISEFISLGFTRDEFFVLSRRIARIES